MKRNVVSFALTCILLIGCGGGKEKTPSTIDENIIIGSRVPTENIISTEEAIRADIPQQAFDELDATLTSLSVDSTSLTGTWLIYLISKGEYKTNSPGLEQSLLFRTLRSEMFTIIDNEVLDGNNKNIRVNNCVDSTSTRSNEFYDRDNQIIPINISTSSFQPGYDSQFSSFFDFGEANLIAYEKTSFSAKVIDNRRIDFFTGQELTDNAGDYQGNFNLMVRARKIRDSINQGVGTIKFDEGSEKSLQCLETNLSWNKMLMKINGGASVMEYDSIKNTFITLGSSVTFDVSTAQTTGISSSAYREEMKVFTDNFYEAGIEGDSSFKQNAQGVLAGVSDSENSINLGFNTGNFVQDTISETFIDTNKPKLNWSMTGVKQSDGSSVSIELTIDPF